MQFQTPPHSWDVTPAAAIGVQKELRSRVRTDIPMALDSVRFIAGVDCSNTRFHPLITAGVILWDRIENKVVDTSYAQANGTFPYIPGLLSFREIPILLKAIEQLQREPDVWMVDGQGIAHPRRLGIAAHLGVLIDRPTIGVAKSRLTGTFDELGPSAGDQSLLMDHEEQIGVVLRTKARSNPLFISPGHRIDLPSAFAIMQASMRGYKLPEPTRLAHLFVNEMRTSNAQPALL
jgi:deoxyribonuclease V